MTGKTTLSNSSHPHSVAHDIPMAGHFGKKKTADRILRRFYWLGLHQDVAQHCTTCEQCQKSWMRKGKKAPLVPQTDGLVEQFNGTLKAILRKTATEEGKDWDRLLPYLLFTYREVPQASTGFSPFELLYVRGPLNVLKESWKASTRSTESVVSYVLMVQERLERLRDLVHENLQDAQDAQKTQKEWYNRNARDHEFRPRDQVLILLPTSTNKLLAEWRGPYPVIRKVSDVNYEVKLTDS